MCHSSVASLPGRPAANCDALRRLRGRSRCCRRRCRNAAACNHGVGPTAPHTSQCRDIRCELCDFPQRYQNHSLSLFACLCSAVGTRWMSHDASRSVTASVFSKSRVLSSHSESGVWPSIRRSLRCLPGLAWTGCTRLRNLARTSSKRFV